MSPDTLVEQAETLKRLMTETAGAVEAELERRLPRHEGPLGRLFAAMRHGALGGGKRLRPFLVIESARLFGVPDRHSLAAAAALEMIHCYSLIHDDLPAMDDSDLRRGRPTVHVAFDDATAILAGDGLLTEAFSVLSAADTGIEAEVSRDLVARLAGAAGPLGMVGGQMIDLSEERHSLDLAGITTLQRLKTGALIGFACEAGAILGRADPAARSALQAYARDLGLAFQIVDDLLDLEADEAELGKPTGQDAERDKATFVGLLGLEGARERASRLVEDAVRQLSLFGERAEPLELIARFVLSRRS